MNYLTPIHLVLGLAAGFTAWVGAIIANRRFATERAILVVRDVTMNAHGIREVSVQNIGERGAVTIRLVVGDETVDYLDGLAAGDQRSMRLPHGALQVEIGIHYVDAARHPRCLRRSITEGEAPSLMPIDAPGRMTMMLRWLHLVEVQ